MYADNYGMPMLHIASYMVSMDKHPLMNEKPTANKFIN